MPPLPAAVFSDEALIAYCDDPKLSVHWPVPKEVRQFLSAYAAKLGLDIQGFDAMARAPRAHTPARAAPYTPLSPYVDSPPVTEEQRAHLAKLKRELAATLHRKHKQVARDDAEARRSAEAQLALLLQGDRDAAARALAENNARRYPWLYPKPAESAPIAAPPLPSAEVLSLREIQDARPTRTPEEEALMQVKWTETEPGHTRPFVRYTTAIGESARFFLDGIGSLPDWPSLLASMRDEGCEFPEGIEALVPRYASLRQRLAS